MKFKTVVETATDAIIITDQNSIIISSNSKVQEVFGYTNEDLFGQELTILMPPQYREYHRKGVERFLNTGIPKLMGHVLELEAQKKDGTIFPVELSLSYWEENGFFFFTGIIRDISQRKKTEETLKENQHFIQRIVEVSPVIISVYDVLNKESIYINQEATDILGYSLDELKIMGKGSKKIPIHPDDWEKAMEWQKKISELQDESAVELEIRVQHSNGNYRWLFTRATEFKKTGEGILKQALIVAFDNTDKKISEDRYKLLIEGVRDYAIFMLDPEGNITTWNEGAKRLKGYTEKEIIGKHFSIFYPKAALERHFPDYELEEAKKNGRFEDEGWRVRKDGTQFYARVVITAIYDKDKKLVGFSKITQDLTEKKQAQEKLSRLNIELEQRVTERTEELSQNIEELKKINTDLDNFIYTASHDLRAPVANIEGLITAIKSSEKYSEISKDMKDLLDMVDLSVEKFKHTILDLTEISRAQKSLEEANEEIDISEIIDETQFLLKDLIKSSNAIIKSKLKILKLQFSKRNFRSIIYNLLSNALKYQSPKRMPEIIIKTERVDDFVLLSIQDNGLGIEAEKIGKIFTMFQRLYTHVEGTGVGLYIVKRIVDNSGGRIEVESEKGKGSIFKVYFKI
ncbi:MAG: PAS domain S-box protein [Sporocytophaga sp.]|uniref:PAS domain S-box protein n=1 Tax=Sporocytophaga sp. TaxID=2231183 RepID=UPI001B2441B6|nr:PAS domain S-box protein [Sporocytophaga sp.]MBO9703338.1 PAS domain S-box protein [Sporocytophaga sp.]